MLLMLWKIPVLVIQLGFVLVWNCVTWLKAHSWGTISHTFGLLYKCGLLQRITTLFWLWNHNCKGHIWGLKTCSRHVILNICNYANSKVTLLWNSSSYKLQINKLLSVFLTIPRCFGGISKRYVKNREYSGNTFLVVMYRMWTCAGFSPRHTWFPLQGTN